MSNKELNGNIDAFEMITKDVLQRVRRDRDILVSFVSETETLRSRFSTQLIYCLKPSCEVQCVAQSVARRSKEMNRPRAPIQIC